MRECFLFETMRGSGEGADFHTDSTDCTASDFLVSSLHVFAACFWREQFCPCHADFPFLAGNRSAGAGIGTESTAAAEGNWSVDGGFQGTIGEQASQTDTRTEGMVQEHGAFSDGTKPGGASHMFVGISAGKVPAVVVDALGGSNR